MKKEKVFTKEDVKMIADHMMPILNKAQEGRKSLKIDQDVCIWLWEDGCITFDLKDGGLRIFKTKDGSLKVEYLTEEEL